LLIVISKSVLFCTRQIPLAPSLVHFVLSLKLEAPILGYCIISFYFCVLHLIQVLVVKI